VESLEKNYKERQNYFQRMRMSIMGRYNILNLLILKANSDLVIIGNYPQIDKVCILEIFQAL